jgi:hypothetical protein
MGVILSALILQLPVKRMALWNGAPLASFVLRTGIFKVSFVQCVVLMLAPSSSIAQKRGLTPAQCLFKASASKTSRRKDFG